MTSKKNVIIISSILGAVCVLLLVLLIIFAVRSHTYAVQLENTYKKAFYELAGNVQSVELDLSKLVATNDSATQAELLNNIYQVTNTANGNLSALPITNNKVKGVNKFLNTLGGYSYSLLDKVNSGGALDDADYANITWLHRTARNANYDINNYVNQIKDNYKILNDVKLGNGDESLWEGGLTNVESSTNKLPSLIYDGPFSDSVLNKEIKGISGSVVTIDEAKQVLKEHFGKFGDYDIEYVGDTKGKFASYNFNVTSAEDKLYVQITKEGAFILSVTALDVDNKQPIIDLDQCETLATNFTTLLGIPDMQTVWSQQSGNAVYLNLAPVIDGVIYYPDLIKVKVDRGLGRVIGYEATNYAYNHTNRPQYAHDISLDDGATKLSSALEVVDSNYCVIPNKWVGESNALEYVCKWEDYTYYVYLSATDGSELNILRVIDTTSGNLLQ